MIDIFVDSGAYSLYHAFLETGKFEADYSYVDSPKFWTYVDDYAEFIKKNLSLITVYVNVDVIFNPEASWKVQKYLEEKHGLHPLPVFHFGEDFKWLKKYMDGYEYFGISGLGPEINKNMYYEWADRIFNLVCSDSDCMPKWKIHGFAQTSMELLSRYPFYSVDSTSWVMFGRYGAILIPKSKNGERNFLKTPTVIFCSDRSPKLKDIDGKHYDRLSFIEQDYIDEYLDELGCTIEEAGTNHKIRDLINANFYVSLEHQLPEWPWPFQYKRHKLW